MDNPGKYRHKITFCRQIDDESDESNLTGQRLEPIRTVFAAVKASAGSENYMQDRLSNSVPYDVRTRFFKDLCDDTLIILYKGERLEIRSIVNIGEKNTDLAFTCVKILREGTYHGTNGLYDG